MINHRISMLIAGCLILALCLSACNSLALTGPKKYKVDLQNIMLQIKSEIDNQGSVSEKTMNKLDGFLEKHREEFGGKGSFMRSEEALEAIKEAKAGEAEGKNVFQKYLEVKQSMNSAGDMLAPEITEG